MITLDDGTNPAVELPDDLIWIDEFAWSAIKQKVDVSLGGALIIQESQQLAGRPITLEGGSDHGWSNRADVVALYALAEQTDLTMTLTLHDARTFNVRFARPAIAARGVVAYSQPNDNDPWSLTVNLITV